MNAKPTRPFYGSFAWAYDLLSDRPIVSECAQIASLLSARGVPSDARLLDAGCGTGRHAVALAGRGYHVTGLDASADLIAVARQREAVAGVTLITADLTALPAAPRYEAILCRGVLNDLVDDRTRRSAFEAFARALVSGGAIVLDVREWEATARRKAREPVHERTVQTVHGTLTFRSETRLDHAARRLLITERHVLASPGLTTSADHDFVMRCWTRDELDALVDAAGFTAVEYRASFDPASPVGSTDRLVVVASRS